MPENPMISVRRLYEKGGFKNVGENEEEYIMVRGL